MVAAPVPRLRLRPRTGVPAHRGRGSGRRPPRPATWRPAACGRSPSTTPATPPPGGTRGPGGAVLHRRSVPGDSYSHGHTADVTARIAPSLWNTSHERGKRGMVTTSTNRSAAGGPGDHRPPGRGGGQTRGRDPSCVVPRAGIRFGICRMAAASSAAPPSLGARLQNLEHEVILEVVDEVHRGAGPRRRRVIPAATGPMGRDWDGQRELLWGWPPSR